MIRGLSILLLVVQLGGCATPARLSEIFQPDVYTVVRGDTVYSIAWRYQLDHNDLIRWNALEPPYRIHPGQKLRLVDARPAPATKAEVPSQPGPAPTPTPKLAEPAPAAPPEVKVMPLEAKADLSPTRWIWPAKGQVLRGFESRSPGRKGIHIGGREGQPVVAAADGRVVYSGNGLPAYGNLVIVRHDDIYLSAYAHNREILVAEGESVRQGQPIAAMGLSENREPLLHFEIRRNGQPVDPLTLLPGR